MTLQEAKSIARHLGLTLHKVRSGDYRMNFRDGKDTGAYYTDNLEDAVNTAVESTQEAEMRSIVIAIALTTVSISFAAVLHDLERLPTRAAR